MPDGTEKVLSGFGYDAQGRITSSQANGQTRYFVYDAAGNQRLSYQYSDAMAIISRTDYDDEGRVEHTFQYVLDEGDVDDLQTVDEWLAYCGHVR